MRSTAAAAIIAATAPLRRLAPAKETRQTELLGFRLAHAYACVCIWLVLLLLRRRGQRTVRCTPNARHGHRRGGQQQVRQFLPVLPGFLVVWWCGGVAVRLLGSIWFGSAAGYLIRHRKPKAGQARSRNANCTV